jgi:hypothetical protein
MIFVPLTFVTSVFGMTNMDTTPEFWQFGVTLATVCVPFFLLIGFLNTEAGYRIWMRKTKELWNWLRGRPQPAPDPASAAKVGPEFDPTPVNRTLSTEEGMKRRLGGVLSNTQSSPTQTETHPNIGRIVRAVGDGKQNGSSKKEAACSVCEEDNEEAGKASEDVDKVSASGDTVIHIEDGRRYRNND